MSKERTVNDICNDLARLGVDEEALDAIRLDGVRVTVTIPANNDEIFTCDLADLGVVLAGGDDWSSGTFEIQRRTLDGTSLEGLADVDRLRQVERYAREVMDALAEHGPGIVGHLLDTDDNSGERLRRALGEPS